MRRFVGKPTDTRQIDRAPPVKWRWPKRFDRTASAWRPGGSPPFRPRRSPLAPSRVLRLSGLTMCWWLTAPPDYFRRLVQGAVPRLIISVRGAARHPIERTRPVHFDVARHGSGIGCGCTFTVGSTMETGISGRLGSFAHRSLPASAHFQATSSTGDCQDAVRDRRLGRRSSKHHLVP